MNPFRSARFPEPMFQKCKSVVSKPKNLIAVVAFREAARIAVRIVPFWGNAVSGVVAGAGTYAIGRAAIAYFIDDAPLAETRRLFTGPWCNSTTRAMSP